MQPKNVAFPIDARLLEVSIGQLGKLVKAHDVPLRKYYRRLARRAAMMAGRYAHAKQFLRMNREIKFLAPAWDGSSAISGARSRMTRVYRRSLPCRSAGPLKSGERQRGWKLYT